MSPNQPLFNSCLTLVQVLFHLPVNPAPCLWSKSLASSCPYGSKIRDHLLLCSWMAIRSRAYAIAFCSFCSNTFLSGNIVIYSATRILLSSKCMSSTCSSFFLAQRAHAPMFSYRHLLIERAFERFADGDKGDDMGPRQLS